MIVNRFLKFFGLLAVIVIGSWLLLHRDQIDSVSDAWDLAQRQWRQHGSTQPAGWETISDARSADTLRIASFNLHNYGPAKAGRPHVLNYYGRIIRQFDVVAIQEIRTRDTNAIAALLDAVNQGSQRYAILTSPRIGRTHIKEQYAFIYDRSRVQPLGNPYVVSDPDDMLHREPFVGWFRAIGSERQRSFTFSLANLHIDPDLVSEELEWLDDLMRAIRNDGRFEDDVILLGDLNASDHELIPALAGTDLNWLVRDVKTNTRSTAAYDNLVINQKATVEFTGRSGTCDFMRQFNLTLGQALEVSDHLPVWAEFSVEEGRRSGFVAANDRPVVR